MKRFPWWLLAVATALILSVPRPVLAQEALLSIVFTGNTSGHYGPCPKCGLDAVGGLDRRSTLMRDMLRASSTPEDVLMLAGGYEFRPFRARKKSPAGLGKALAEAFAMFPYDLAYMVPAERSWLEDGKAAPPEGWLTAGPEALTRVLDKGGMRVGVVVFPARDDVYAPPDAALMAEAARACGALRPRVDLLVAMSAWGEPMERAFLGAHGDAVDILLGSGPALGAGLREMQDGRVLWLRAVFDGEKVPVLRILERPGAGGSHWIQGVDYTYEAVPLGPGIKADPKVNAIFAWI